MSRIRGFFLATSAALSVAALGGCELVIALEERRFEPEGSAGNSGQAGAPQAGAGGQGQGGEASGAAGQAGAGGCQCACALQAPEARPTIAVCPPSGACFCVDTFEVSAAEYDAFASGRTPASASPACKDNTSLERSCEQGEPNTSDASPAHCVDWCDAKEFCEFHQRRLCESRTLDGVLLDEWVFACDGGNQRTHSTLTKSGGQCVDSGYSQEKCGAEVCPTSTLESQCVTPEGAVNLSGNIAEWTGDCEDTSGVSSECQVRGGSFLDSFNDIKCVRSTPLPRTTRQKTVGFRCCKDP